MEFMLMYGSSEGVGVATTDRDAVLELQPLIEQVYERGRYETLNYDRDLDPPLSEPDRIWVDEVLRTSGLRS